MTSRDRYLRLLARRAPAEDRSVKYFAESYERIHGDNTQYILGAMKAVEEQYTQRLVEQGNRIENQLAKRLAADYSEIEFRRQGSVSNGTHIRYYSDVDVLVIIDKFTTLEPPQKPLFPYAGNPADDLVVLRRSCAGHLSNAFPQATVDHSGSTALCISGGSLTCEVDVVPANWYDTVKYANGGGEEARGIMVLDRTTMERRKNFPFTFNARIEEIDRRGNGIPRMMIRLLKSIKADYEEEHSGQNIALSSYDLCSIVYRMESFNIPIDEPFSIAHSLAEWMLKLLQDDDLRNSLLVVDDSRAIFANLESTKGLLVLATELVAMLKPAINEQGSYSFKSNSHIAGSFIQRL